MRRYYLHIRKNVYYAELVTPEGHKLNARSTHKTTESEALLVVSKWLSEGIPCKTGKEKPVETVMGLAGILKAIRKTDLDGDSAMKIVELLRKKELIDIPVVSKTGSGARLFTEFLEQFWDFASSPYVRSKLVDGDMIGRRHTYEMLSRVHSFYFDYFKDRSLNSITKKDLTEFKLFLSEPRIKPEGYRGKFAEKLSAAYRNKILIAGLTALKWAFSEGIIATNPGAGFKRVKGTAEKRRVLTPTEAAAVFKTNWKDKRSCVGNILAVSTGLRAGEVLALRKSDIGDRVLYIRHSWSTMDGLKSPKNGEARKVPLLPEVRDRIIELLGENPHRVDDPFIFYGLLETKPMDTKILIDGLKAACKEAGVEPVTFHSWRHFFAARLADRMSADAIARVTGHRSRAVLETYMDHLIDKNLEDMGEAAAQTLENVIPFRKVG